MPKKILNTFLKIIVYTFLALSLLWGTFSAFLLFDAKYHLVEKIKGEGNRVKEGIYIPSFYLINLKTNEKTDSFSATWGKNILYFFDPKNIDSKNDVQYLLSIKELFPEKKLKILPILLTSLNPGQLNSGQKIDYYTISSLKWRYRVKPTFWFVENGKLMKLVEGITSKNELKELTLKFI